MLAPTLITAFLLPLPTADAVIDAGRGPIDVAVPQDYDGTIAAPLIILLHGYGSSGDQVESYLDLGSLVDDYGFFLLAPDGEEDCVGLRYWNATEACCDLCGEDTNDAGYLRGVIAEMKREFFVDPRRIYFVGHSNGGFMAHRMACEHGDLVAGIASIAGATYDDAGDCAADRGVHILQIHGTDDGVIEYDGDCTIQGCYPGALETCGHWADLNGCDPVAIDGGDRDLVISPGDDTDILRWEGCRAGSSVELWTIDGANHFPLFRSSFFEQLVEYLFAHPKPVDSVRKDDFNDEMIGPQWIEIEDRIEADERGGKLKFRSQVSGAGVRESGYAGADWSLRFTRDYTVKMKYRVDVNGVTGGKWAAAQIRLRPASGDIGVIRVAVRQESSGLFLVYEADAPDGSSLDFVRVPVTTEKGVLKVIYDKSDDAFDVQIANQTEITITSAIQGLDPGNGRATVEFGAARKGFVPWGWNRLWIDNARVEGRIVD